MANIPDGHPECPEGQAGRTMLERMNAGHHEELANWGLGHIRIAADAQMLDVGCGGGANLARLLALAPEGHVTGVDYSPLSVQMSGETNSRAIAEGKCEVIRGNVRDLPLPDASFDVATAFETVYFWDMPAGFAEVHRVLKPGGLFLICNEDNGTGQDALQAAEEIPGMVVPTGADLVALLEEAGFQIDAVDDEYPDGLRVVVIASA